VDNSQDEQLFARDQTSAFSLPDFVLHVLPLTYRQTLRGRLSFHDMRDLSTAAVTAYLVAHVVHL